MKFFFAILFFPLNSLAQYEPNQKLHFRAAVTTDSANVTGYLVYNSDSAVILSPKKRYSPDAVVPIPVNTIKELHLRNKRIYWGGVAVLSVLGFMITAGLTQNSDIDNDGKTSFFELIVSAVEGSTSKNKSRRRKALMGGVAGGTAGFFLGVFINKNFSLVFPINNRNNFYREKKASITKFIDF